MYIAYLDEFGHIGPFVSKNDPSFNTHPVFGLAGVVLPKNHVRTFSSFFYNVKRYLLQTKIQESGKHPAEFEEKSSTFFRTSQFNGNSKIKKEKIKAINRIIKKVEDFGGFLIYVGIEKDRDPNQSNAKNLYKQILKETIKRLDEEMKTRNSKFMIVLDQQDDMNKKSDGNSIRQELVKQASFSMFGSEHRTELIEPPIQAESHLYQTIQCADWVCGLVGKITYYELQPMVVPENKVYYDLFFDRLHKSQRRSGIRKKV